MKKSLKRIVCGFLVLVMIVPVIAMFPSLKVEADDIENDVDIKDDEGDDADDYTGFIINKDLSYVHNELVEVPFFDTNGNEYNGSWDHDWDWHDGDTSYKSMAEPFNRDARINEHDINNGVEFISAIFTDSNFLYSNSIDSNFGYSKAVFGANMKYNYPEYCEAISDKLNIDEKEDLIGIYAYGKEIKGGTEGANLTKNYTIRLFVACDYNKIDKNFIYYIIDAQSVEDCSDDIYIIVGTCDELLSFAFEDEISARKMKPNDKDVRDIINEVYDGSELIDMLTNGYSANNISRYSNLDTLDHFFKIVRNDSSVDELSPFAEVKGLAYNVNPDADYLISFKYNGVLKMITDDGSDGDSDKRNTVKLIVNDKGGKFITQGCTVLNPDEIIQGGNSKKDIIDSVNENIGEDCMSELVSAIISTVASNSSDMTIDSIDNVLLSSGFATKDSNGNLTKNDDYGKSDDDYCVFLFTVLYEYREVLNEVINASHIEDRFESSDRDLLSDATDYFEAAQVLLQYNIQEMSKGNNTIGHEFYFENAPDTTDSSDDKRYLTLEKKLDDAFWWGELEPYQKEVLWSAYSQKLNRLKKTTGRLYCCDYDDSFDQDAGKAIINNLSSRYYTIDKAIEDLNGKRIEDLQATGSITVLCSYADLAAEYVVFSSLYSNNTGGDIESIYSLYNAQLDSMVTNIWNYDKVSDNYLPSMPKHIGIFDGDDPDVNYHGMLETNENWNRFVALLGNVEYAFATCAFSDIKDLDTTSKYTPDQIKSWFIDNSSKRDDSNSVVNALVTMRNETQAGNYELAQLAKSWGQLDPSAQYMLRSILALEKMCQFLDIGMDDWSEQIKAYRQIYIDWKDFFDALDASGVMYSLAQEGTKTVDEPLGMFFSISEKQMTDQWVTGFALSSLYVPMETNVYDASSVTWLNNSDWVSDFYYKYGFYRKALYINTDNSAIVNNFVSGTQTGRRVATLSDLLNYDRDIILYVDDNFYNARDIDTVISRLDYTAIRNSNADPTDPDAEESDNADVGLAQIGNAIAGMLDLDAGTILKTGTNTQYSTNLKSNCSQLGQEESTVTIKQKIFDEYLLSSGEILGDEQTESALDAYEYSVKTPYAVVSAVYRNDELYNETLRCAMYDTAIFKSSKAIASTPGTTSSNWRSLYNYYMLANLEEQMKNDTATVLDLDAPIFVDVFGNILTESGLVIIPAACNATLCGENWSPYTVGWSTYYNHGNQMTTDDFNSDVYEWLTGRPVSQGGIVDATEVQSAEKKNGGGYFVISGKKLVLLTSELTSGNITGTIQWDIINKNSTIVKQLFFNDAYFKKGENMYSHALTNLIIETMRGAPIENIDYSYEGLSGTTDISKYGVYMAYKLEELVDMLGGKSTAGNSVVTMPNLAFVEGVEYIMMYVFKIVFSLMIVALGVSLYLDAVRGGLGIKSVVHFIATCLMVFVAFTLLPDVTNWTYYSANKNLLSDEAGRLMMLNYVKEYDGSEIGITKVTTPETETKLYMKLSDLDVPWWDIIPEVLFGNSGDTVSELYENSLKDNPMAMTPEVEMKSDGLYVDLQDVYDSSDIQFVPASNMLQHYTRIGYSNVSIPTTVLDGVDDSGNPIYHTDSVSFAVGTNCLDAVSFVSPYYAILDQLVANINEYNVSRDITAYSWSVGSNGHVLTYDVISPYLTSPEFIEEGYDILGLDRILKLPMQRTLYNYAFDDTDIAKMCRSSWYRDIDDYSGDYLRSRIDKLYLYARDYIAANRDVFGKVPDEVFLKVFAMQLAVEYNKIFGNIHGNAIEIIDVDTRDLMRFMVSDYADMYKYYSYSFSRYVYEEGGVLAVVFSSLLLVLYWATSFIKPLIMLVILGLLVLNVILRKTIFTQSNKAVEGYLIGMACLALCNYAYAFALKASLNIANLGLGTATALVFAFLVQVLYIIGLLGICVIEVKDWKNNGFYGFSAIGSNIMSQVMSAKNLVTDRLLSKGNEAYANSSEKRRFTSWSSDSVEDMLERDVEREERGTYSPN